MVKNPPAIAGDMSSISGLGRSPGGGGGNPLLYSCLEKSHGQRNHGVFAVSRPALYLTCGLFLWQGGRAACDHGRAGCNQNWGWVCSCPDRALAWRGSSRQGCIGTTNPPLPAGKLPPYPLFLWESHACHLAWMPDTFSRSVVSNSL